MTGILHGNIEGQTLAWKLLLTILNLRGMEHVNMTQASGMDQRLIIRKTYAYILATVIRKNMQAVYEARIIPPYEVHRADLVANVTY